MLNRIRGRRRRPLDRVQMLVGDRAQMLVAGVALGRYLVDRKLEKRPRKHHGLAEAAAEQEQDRADTDVFAAVRHPGADESTEQTAPTQARREER